MQTEEMQQAMSTLEAFSEKERAYHLYQARQNYLRQQRSTQRRMAELTAAAEESRVQAEQARAEKEREHAEKEQALAAQEQARAQTDAALQREASALAEIERLKRLLAGQ